MTVSVFGLIGPKCLHQSRKRWNQLFLTHGKDAVFDFYPTRTYEDLELRFSEMFLHERRGYLIADALQVVACKLLDVRAPSSIASGKVSVVVNDGGVLTGHWIDTGDDSSVSEILRLWFPRPRDS